MAARAKKGPRKKAPAKRFQFQLGWGGLVSVVVVSLCLFLWMFLLGIWAGQTILFPAPGVKQVASVGQEDDTVARQQQLTQLRPAAKKKAVKGKAE
jgi:hypothetical protein